MTGAAGRPTVWVYGAGAVGSLLGGLLAAAGLPVVLIARPARREALEAQGLRLRLPGGVLTVRPRVATSLGEAAERSEPGAEPDLVVLAVKSWGTAAAAAEMAALWPRGARPVVLTVQNGLGNEEALAAALGEERVWSGALTVAVSVPRPAEVEVEGGRGGLAVTSLRHPGRPGPGQEDVWEAVLEAARAGGLSAVPAGAGYRSLKWSKLLLNLLGNATCAALDRLPAEALADRRVFALEREAFLEGCRVAAAAGVRLVDLPGYPVRLLRRVLALPLPVAHRLLYRRIAGGRGGKPPSFLLDLRAGRRTEIAFLHGAIAARARALGLAAPVNAALTDLLDGLADGTLPRERFAGRPDRVLAFVEARRAGRS